MSAPIYDEIPDTILNLASEAAAHALEDFEAAEDRRAARRQWRRARAGAVLALLRDHYHRTIIFVDRHKRWERKAIKREVEARLPEKLAHRQNAVADLRRLRELVRLVDDAEDLEAVLARAQVAKLRRELFAPFGAGEVLRAEVACAG